MAWRFRKSVKILPGVRLNVTNRGVSTTLGGAPFSLNVGRGGMRRTISVPGTGLYNTESVSGESLARPSGRTAWVAGLGVLVLLGMCSAASESPSAPAGPAAVVSNDSAQTIVFAQRTANCRAAATTKSDIFTKLSPGERLSIQAPAGDFHQVRTKSGLTCFVAGFLVAAAPPTLREGGANLGR